jgi:hypothetical protein
MQDRQPNVASRLRAMAEIARTLDPHPRLMEWGAQHLGLDGDRLRDWAQRAWWGVAAGELAIGCLRNDTLRGEFLALMDPPDWRPVEAARAKGGVILATAHLGPRRTAMYYCFGERWPLMVWSHNGPGQPSLAYAHRMGVEVLDAMDPATSSFILGRTALHLRAGGLLLAAADIASSARPLVIDRLGCSWRFSPGMPMLARRLGVPVFLVFALWRGLRLHITVQALEPPAMDLPEEQWLHSWIGQYWDAMERIILSSPENLRFLRWLFSPEEAKALLAPAGIGLEGCNLSGT